MAGLTRPSIPLPRLLCRLMEGRATRHQLDDLEKSQKTARCGKPLRCSPPVRAVFVLLTHMAPSPIDPQQPRRSSTRSSTAATRSFRPHRPAAARRPRLLPHPAMADVLPRADRVLRRGRAARPLSLFDRRVRRVVHHAIASFRCRAGCSAATTRCFGLRRARLRRGRSGRRWFGSANLGVRLSRSRCMLSVTIRCPGG